MGDTLACFQLSGKTPWSKDELKRKANGLAITDITIFIKKFGILSGPDPLEVLNVDMMLIISSSDISEKRNSLEKKWEGHK